MLLIDDDESESLKGQKNRRPRPENHVVRLVGKLFLPDFDALGIAVFRMVNAQPIAENSAQSLHHLHGQGNFGQQIKHLTAFVEGFLDEVDVDFGLAARRDAVQQHDALVFKLRLNLVESLLLWFAQRLDLFGMRLATVVQPPHFTLVSIKDFAVDERFQHRRSAVAFVHQFVAGDV